MSKQLKRKGYVSFRLGIKMSKNRTISTNKILLKNTFIKLPKLFYTKQLPDNIPSPHIWILNNKLANDLGMDLSFLQSKEGAEFLSGNQVLENTNPIAQAYAGHQFGYFTMLGDGRAILLGEYQAKDGEKYDIQLKGSGRTPYSRGGDGKAALGPMLREYIISEGMHGLGIPTTRSLAVSVTGETVIREELLEGAVLTRIAKSHIRVGTFEYASKFLGKESVKALADYTIKRHYPTIEGSNENTSYHAYHSLLQQVIKKQAYLIAKWQLVGFIHGVMNTDNMAISGETIDYGPCAFMDRYKPDTVFSSIDTKKRYAYQNQPTIAMWNLARFSETLLPLLAPNPSKAIEIAEKEIMKFGQLYQKYWLDGMGKKLGIFSIEKENIDLIKQLLNLMQKYKADYTDTFFQLSRGTAEQLEIYPAQGFQQWLCLWNNRLSSQNQPKEKVQKIMQQHNPTIIPRNYLVEEALEAAVKNQDNRIMKKLVDALQNPYDYENILPQYTKIPKDNSCSYKTYCGT